MNWWTTLFRRADFPAANLAISEALGRNARPDCEAISQSSGVSEKQVQKLAVGAIFGIVRKRVADGISKGKVLSQQIYDDAIRLGTTPDEAKKALEEAISDHFTELVGQILEDGQVDPAEDERLRRFMAMIDQAKLGAETSALIDEGRKLLRACNAPMQPVDAPVLLKKGEFCVYVVAAEAIEDRARTVRVGYHGPSARIRIAKGFYYGIM